MENESADYTLNSFPTLSLFIMQDQETTNQTEFTDVFRAPASGRLLALDLGTKRIGVAVSDELQFTVRAVCIIERTSWKKVLKQVIGFLKDFDAVGLVLGLPLNTDGSESEMSGEARRLYQNFSLSLDLPVFLQDERVSTYAARGHLWKLGLNEAEIRRKLDSEAAAIILSDFLSYRNQIEKNQTRINGSK